MSKIKRLPDAEFEIMQVVWENDPPITTGIVMKQLGEQKNWKAATIISLMLRLVKRGFLHTEKNGKERSYFPLVKKDEYLQFETDHFIKQYHGNSFTSLISSLVDSQKLSDRDLEELLQLIRKERE